MAQDTHPSIDELTASLRRIRAVAHSRGRHRVNIRFSMVDDIIASLTMLDHTRNVGTPNNTASEAAALWHSAPQDALFSLATDIANHPAIREKGVEFMADFHGFVQETGLKYCKEGK